MHAPKQKGMKSYRNIFTALLLGVTLCAHTQTDKGMTYGASGFAIPGSSAITFAVPKTLQGQHMMPSSKASLKPLPTSHSSAEKDTRPLQNTQLADTTQNDAQDKLQQSNSMRTYPAPLSLYHNYSGLHQGLNVNIGLSVFAMFGKHAPRGAGFSQNISATWLQPLGKQAWLAAGGYLNNTTWSGNNYTSGGLYGELGYQFNEHWAGYIYGQKSIVNNGMQPCGYLYGRGMYHLSPMMYNNWGDKLGAAIRWTPNPTMSIEVSVEKNWYPNSNFGYADRYKYNYPIPEK